MSIGRRPPPVSPPMSEMFGGVTFSAPLAEKRRPALAPPNAMKITPRGAAGKLSLEGRWEKTREDRGPAPAPPPGTSWMAAGGRPPATRREVWGVGAGPALPPPLKKPRPRARAPPTEGKARGGGGGESRPEKVRGKNPGNARGGPPAD